MFASISLDLLEVGSLERKSSDKCCMVCALGIIFHGTLSH